MHVYKYFAAIALVQTVISVPCLASDINANAYAKSFSELEQKYDAPEIGEFFRKAQDKPDEYFSAVLTQRFAIDHSYPCLSHYRDALEAAKNHDLALAKRKIEESKEDAKPDKHQKCQVADIWITSALINKALGNNADAIKDLGIVYEYRKNHPTSWDEGSDLFGAVRVKFPQ